MVIQALLALAGRAFASRTGRFVGGTVLAGTGATLTSHRFPFEQGQLLTAADAAFPEQDKAINTANIRRTTTLLANIRLRETSARGEAGRRRVLAVPINESEISLGAVFLLVQQLLRVMNKLLRSRRLRRVFAALIGGEVKAWIVCTRNLIIALEEGGRDG